MWLFWKKYKVEFFPEQKASDNWRYKEQGFDTMEDAMDAIKYEWTNEYLLYIWEDCIHWTYIYNRIKKN